MSRLKLILSILLMLFLLLVAIFLPSKLRGTKGNTGSRGTGRDRHPGRDNTARGADRDGLFIL